MTNFDSTKTELSKLLEEIVTGKIQLPDFQRGWVWDDEHIRSLLVSIARSFPIGAVMLLETGGEARFQVRMVEGIALPKAPSPERLILDGQQRLTSLTQVLKLPVAVTTRDDKKQEIKRYYYFDINKALAGASSLEDAVMAVGEDRIIRTYFGRDIKLDLSTPEKEYAAFHFPCNQILNSDAWEEGLNNTFPDRFPKYMKFRKEVLSAFRSYLVPVIELKKETTKEAVCMVFEKVNTGGVQLTVFELVTAAYAADGLNLRRDWFGDNKAKGRLAKLAVKPLLKDTATTEFLQGICLLHTYEQQQQDIKAAKAGKDITGVSAKREHILSIPSTAYQKWADALTSGFLEAEQFLRHLGFYHPNYLPYRAQVIPLAAVLTLIKERWLEPQVQIKLMRWYWCGVFGELYGSASETRIALDLQDLLRWIDDDKAALPATIIAAGFQPSRLETMRSRNSAAYRGLYVLLQKEGAEDFFWKAKMVDIDRNERAIDIHHIFPRKWCEDRAILARVFNSIINKTAISYKANRKIGGNAPSYYLTQLETDKTVQLEPESMNKILRTHLIDPEKLRADDFVGFMESRKAALLKLVETAMGKTAVIAAAAERAVADEYVDADADEEDGEAT